MIKGDVGKKPMREFWYRQSRIARILGDPAKYAIIMLLLKQGPLTLSEIAERVHRTKSTTCFHLSKLRSLEIARYEVHADGVYYWIKYPNETRGIIDALDVFLKRSMHNLQHDT